MLVNTLNINGKKTCANMCEAMRKVFELLCNAETPYIWIADDQGNEQLYLIEDINTHVIAYDRIDDVEISCQFTELIDLMLKLVSDKRRIRILKTIKYSSWQAENGITAGELLQKADIRIPTKKELETVNILL